MNLEQVLAELKKHPPEAQSQALIQHLRHKFDSDLYLLCKYGLGYSAMTRKTHGPMCKILEEQLSRKLLVMPRGTFKSSIGVVGYSIASLTKDPNVRILIDSEKYDNSKNFIREIKGKVSDPVFKLLYGDWIEGGSWTEGEVVISKRTIVKKEANLTASGIGAGKTGQHYDKILHDDLNSHENSQNPEQRRKVLIHYKMNTSILDPGGEIVVIGTRYATDDVIGFILDNEVNPKGLLPSE